MISLHHSTIEIDGHVFLYEPLFLGTKEECEKHYNDFVDWARSQVRNGGSS